MLLLLMSEVVTLRSARIEVVIAPEVGGRIVSFKGLRSGYEFLWRNPGVPLRLEEPGTAYDPNFYGGIDELLPNDIPEILAGEDCPDHGELWTTSFSVGSVTGDSVSMVGCLPNYNFSVEKDISVFESECTVSTRITNLGSETKHFLWKLHAALTIQPGDLIECAAECFEPADIEWSRRACPGEWWGEMVPDFDGTTEFLYLCPLLEGRIGWRRGSLGFEVLFDPEVFPYAWYFASYGGFDGHHFAILEPCTTMPISVNEALERGQTPVLEPQSSIETEYTYRIHED